MSRYRPDDNLLSVISGPVLFWLSIIIISHIMMHFAAPISVGALYTPNNDILGQKQWFNIGGGILAVITLYSAATQPRIAQSYLVKLFFTILGSVILLALAVFLSGGFIDSPFSGAVSLYIGFFILMIRRGRYVLYSILLVVITLFLLSLPYIYLHKKGSASLNILQWNSSYSVTWGRMAANILLLIVAGWVSARVSDEVSRLS